MMAQSAPRPAACGIVYGTARVGLPPPERRGGGAGRPGEIDRRHEEAEGRGHGEGRVRSDLPLKIPADAAKQALEKEKAAEEAATSRREVSRTFAGLGIDLGLVLPLAFGRRQPRIGRPPKTIVAELNADRAGRWASRAPSATPRCRGSWSFAWATAGMPCPRRHPRAQAAEWLGRWRGASSRESSPSSTPVRPSRWSNSAPGDGQGHSRSSP